MKRIKVLDGFRALAISMVVLFHYTASYTKHNTAKMLPHMSISLYPFGDKYVSVFENGYLGVQLFFMISGFVIYMTLENTQYFTHFIFKRVLRLFPLLLLCSIITYYSPFILDSTNRYPILHRATMNFFPSLTFTDLWIWNIILKTKSVEFIDPSYWTLGVEMKYYIISSVLFYINKANFFRNWLVLNIIVIVSYLLVLFASNHSNAAIILTLGKILEQTFFANYIIFFTIGAFFYRLYQGTPVKKTEITIVLLLTVLCMLFCFLFVWSIALIVFSMLFLLFIYRPQYVSFLGSKAILFIGVISYPLYLIHQIIGILLMNFFSDNFHINFSEVYLLLVIALMLLFSYILHIYVENPFNAFLKKRLPNLYKPKVLNPTSTIS